MAPEQLRGEEVDARTDLFALGAVLHEMLTGTRAFGADSQAALIAAILEHDPPPLATLRPDTPPALARLVATCLAKDPADRWQHSHDVELALKEMAERPTEGRGPRDLEPRRLVPRRWVPAIVVALALALAGGLMWVGLERFSARQASARSPIRLVAVLPLQNFSGDPQQEYFADGMTEALIARLSGLDSLRVISHTSVMQFKGARKPVPEIARSLAVDAVVAGSVSRSGSRIRISAQLIRGDPDEILWSGTYDREVGDVLALQSDVAQVIARHVDVTVTGPERTRLTMTRAVSPEVYESYLKGRLQLNQLTRAANETSIKYFEAAIAGDSTFAPAHAGLALAYNALNTVIIGASPPAELHPRAIAAARTALELDPDLADAHAVLASVQQRDYRWAEAGAGFQRALELNPSDARTHAWLAWWLACRGRAEEAIASARRGRDLDPLSQRWGYLFGAVLVLARRHDDAARELRSALALEPNHPAALAFLAAALVQMSKFDEATATLERAVSLSDRSPGLLGALAGAYARAGRRNDARRILDELTRLRQTRHVPAAAFVFAYVGLGEHDRAFGWLDRAYDERSNIMMFLKVQAAYDPLRKDPRFPVLLRRVGLD